ncbi:MAG TPA: tetratricopeptide repeat protein [Nannocystis sp.]
MRPILAAVAACALFLAPGCTKIAARDFIREGNAHYANGQYREAIEKYTKGLELEPYLVTPYWNRACAAESIVLKIKDPNQLADRKLYTDQALSDFKTWLDNLGAEATEADRQAYLNHRLALLDADERCDDLLSYFLEKHNQEPKEEGWYARIAKQYDSCGQHKKAEEWLVKRTVDFPTSVRAYLALASRKLEQLYPEPDSGLQYNANLSEEERLALANEAIALLDKATMIDHKFIEAYIYRSIAYTQRQLARRYGDDPTQNTVYENLNMILAREDGMAAWRQQKAICDIKMEPECPLDKPPEGPCCMLPPRPLTPEEEAADAERKKAIEEEIRQIESGQAAETGKGRKGKGKGSK